MQRVKSVGNLGAGEASLQWRLHTLAESAPPQGHSLPPPGRSLPPPGHFLPPPGRSLPPPGHFLPPHPLARSLARSLTRCRSASNAGIPFAWSDVTVSVGNKGSEVTLLDSLSGYANQGEMLAIMGPSGSGKSTLLDTLSGRKTLGNVQGTIKFGGLKPTQAFVRRYLGYVVQGDDTLLALLTVEEMLRYTAELKLERSVSAEERQLAVDGVIEVLGLDTCRHVVIGDRIARGVSGGQAKRVSIGIALISNPRVLFLDEPTSGLDSFTANEVMSVVKQLALGGITVCATIHSPTPYAFGLFDSLLLLASGRSVYFGPMKGAVDAMKAASASFSGEWDAHAASDRCVVDLDRRALACPDSLTGATRFVRSPTANT